MSKSLTPISDAAVVDAGWIIATHSDKDYVPHKTARKLEIELNITKKRLDWLEKNWEKVHQSMSVNCFKYWSETEQRYLLAHSLTEAIDWSIDEETRSRVIHEYDDPDTVEGTLAALKIMLDNYKGETK